MGLDGGEPAAAAAWRRALEETVRRHPGISLARLESFFGLGCAAVLRLALAPLLSGTLAIRVDTLLGLSFGVREFWQ